MCNVSIIIVNTNTRELTCQCLSSICANPLSRPFEIIVVDNASTDGSCEAIASRFPDVRLIQNLRNVGFAVANNRALEIARGEHVLLLNNDTIVLPQSLDQLLSALDADEHVGIVAPKLIYPDGSLQMSYGPMPSLFVSFCSFFEVRKWLPQELLSRIGRSESRKFLGKNASSYAEWSSIDAPKTSKLSRHLLATGACLLIRGECFRQVGSLDPEFFMYVDDADYCKRVRDAGWDILYVAEATIVHIKGGTVGNRYRWTSAAAYFSVFHFLEKHHGKTTAWIAKALAVLSLACRSTSKTLLRQPSARGSWRLLWDVGCWKARSSASTSPKASRLREEHEHAAD